MLETPVVLNFTCPEILLLFTW